MKINISDIDQLTTSNIAITKNNDGVELELLCIVNIRDNAISYGIFRNHEIVAQYPTVYDAADAYNSTIDKWKKDGSI